MPFHEYSKAGNLNSSKGHFYPTGVKCASFPVASAPTCLHISPRLPVSSLSWASPLHCPLNELIWFYLLCINIQVKNVLRALDMLPGPALSCSRAGFSCSCFPFCFHPAQRGWDHLTHLSTAWAFLTVTTTETEKKRASVTNCCLSSPLWFPKTSCSGFRHGHINKQLTAQLLVPTHTNKPMASPNWSLTCPSIVRERTGSVRSINPTNPWEFSPSEERAHPSLRNKTKGKCMLWERDFF